MPPRAGTLGRFGEDMACEYLMKKGYRIVARNWHTRKGELDIICWHDGILVFVEVKTRGPGSLGEPGEAVGRHKKTRLVRTASAYLSNKGLWESPSRFDLIALRMRGDEIDVEHICNVIDASEIMGGRHTSWQPW